MMSFRSLNLENSDFFAKTPFIYQF